ncbi:MAG: PAS domain S-box protein [Candidatus Nitrosotenuis sp.]|nr:MAG: PAS domain S-box protein [Candidatus Nitrosotenuis sp.]
MSLSVPAGQFFVKAREGIWKSLMAYSAIWLAGVGALYLFSVQRLKGARERAAMQNESARLAGAVMHAADAVAITDSDGIIEYVNPAFETVTGYSLDEARGKNPRVLKSGRHDRSFYEEMWRTIKAGKVWRGKIINRKKDGSLYEEEMTISPVMDAAGSVVNFVAVKRDITRENALQKSRAYFTDITAHELRTPLAKLHLVENLLMQIEGAGIGGRMGEVRNALRDSITSFDRIVNATTLISDMARTGSERPFVRDLVYYDIATALEAAQANIIEARRSIAMDVGMAELPRHATVLGNRGMIQQALDEVFSNAIKFTPDGSSISVRAYAGRSHVHIEVADEGEGIPEDKLRDVFIPYFSLENPLTHSTGRYKFHGGGLGLGLTVAKLIMEYHNGALVIGHRTDREGTLVTLSFPLVDKDLPAA